MEDTVFNKILRKEIPSFCVYEDDKVYAFLDITQATKGHTLVIPKKQVTNIFEYDAQTAADLFSRIPKISRAMEKAFPDMEGLNIVNNNRELAYQSVFYSHVHLIPRYSKKDGFKMSFTDNSARYTPEDMEQIAHAIHKEVEK
ncbi:HIT family protein [Vagococcus entomophilus]|uniref:HIT family protein n=1 Tax=Vagococcus entomophilus TaxID=1160095 RepID=A0A430AGC8_9ENTE|nr:HIT family protein [Vagococcus entomophilus]RSU06965.1 HIT family protein [Vagococcus entomophilus]